MFIGKLTAFAQETDSLRYQSERSNLLTPPKEQTNSPASDAQFNSLSKYEKNKRSALLNQLPHFLFINSSKSNDSHKYRKKAIKLEKEKNEKALLHLLQEYTKKFRISDFKHHSFWIWRLAQIYEKKGKLELAKAWYRLGLLHKPKNLNISLLLKHYDSLTINDKDYYLSLEHYYELVEARNAIDTIKAPRSILTNMGSKINSDSSDYAPAISSDDNYLVFTSKRHEKKGVAGNRITNEDLFISQKYTTHEYGEAMSFDEVNTKYNEGSACFSKDGNILIFSRCFAPDSQGHCDLYETKKDSLGNWIKPVNLGKVNSKYWDSHPSLSHTGDTLYFSSSRQELSFGQEDIFYSVRSKEGHWGKAKNVGANINTKGREISPFIHYNHNILYFSSDNQLVNFGGFDIYKTYKVGENKEYGIINFSDPLNIGPLINEKTNEYYFSIDAKSNDLYYAKSVGKEKKNLDLFTFPLPMEAQPEARVRVEGSFKDRKEIPFQGVISILDLDHGIEVTPKFLRPNGTFSFDLINGRKYLIIIHGDDFFRFEDLFFLSGTKKVHYRTERISKFVEFRDIEFEYNSAELKEEMLFDISKVIDFLVDNPDFLLVVHGHTDSLGSEEENKILSQKRAENIINYIEVFGDIDESRLEAKGHGSKKPIIAEEKTEKDRATNRRVEFELIEMEE